MKKIIIVGCRGAGKSTLAKELSLRTGFKYLDYGNPLNLNIYEETLEGYIMSRREYINFTINSLENLGVGDKEWIIQVKGPETLYTYSVFSPYLRGKNWNICHTLDDEFGRLKIYYSNIILMLDYDKDTIDKRCKNDSKIRQNMEFWKKLWFEYERPYFLKSDKILRFSNSNLSISECVNQITKLLLGKINEKL